MSEKASGSMRELIAQVAGPQTWRDNRKSWIDRAAERAGISYRQAKAIYYGEIQDPDHNSIRRLRRAAIDRAELRMATQEAIALRNQLLSLRNALIVQDPTFYFADIHALECAICAMGGDDFT